MDWTILNNAVASIFCDTLAVWDSGITQVNLQLAIEPKHSEIGEIYAAGNSEIVVAGCPAHLVTNMQRKHVLTFDDQEHSVLQVISEGEWSTIVMEKA